MNFQSKTRHESKTCEGVAFTIRTLNQKRRAEWGLSVADHLAEQDRLQREMAALEVNGKVPDERAVEYQELLFRWVGVNNAHIKPALIDVALVSVEGVTVDDGPAELGAILESASDALLEEIYEACQGATGLSGEDSKNLPSPGTSAGQTDGPTSVSDVQSASA